MIVHTEEALLPFFSLFHHYLSPYSRILFFLIDLFFKPGWGTSISVVAATLDSFLSISITCTLTATYSITFSHFFCPLLSLIYPSYPLLLVLFPPLLPSFWCQFILSLRFSSVNITVASDFLSYSIFFLSVLSSLPFLMFLLLLRSQQSQVQNVARINTKSTTQS